MELKIWLPGQETITVRQEEMPGEIWDQAWEEKWSDPEVTTVFWRLIRKVLRLKGIRIKAVKGEIVFHLMYEGKNVRILKVSHKGRPKKFFETYFKVRYRHMNSSSYDQVVKIRKCPDGASLIDHWGREVVRLLIRPWPEPKRYPWDMENFFGLIKRDLKYGEKYLSEGDRISVSEFFLGFGTGVFPDYIEPEALLPLLRWAFVIGKDFYRLHALLLEKGVPVRIWRNTLIFSFPKGEGKSANLDSIKSLLAEYGIQMNYVSNSLVFITGKKSITFDLPQISHDWCGLSDHEEICVRFLG